MAQVIELRPTETPTQTVASAQRHYITGDYAQAGAISEMYLREHPDDAQALCILSACYKQADRNVLAYALGRRASELRPDRPETWVTHGFAAQSLWKTDEAQDMKEGIKEKAGPVVEDVKEKAGPALDKVKRGVEAGVKEAVRDEGEAQVQGGTR